MTTLGFTCMLFLGCRWNLKSRHLYLCSAETFAPSLNIEAIQLFSRMIELSNRKNLITWYEWLVWVMEQFWATALNRCSALNSGTDLIVSIYPKPCGLISFSMLQCLDRVFQKYGSIISARISIRNQQTHQFTEFQMPLCNSHHL